MTMHEVVVAQLNELNSQIAAYTADINNLLPMLSNAQQTAAVLTAWLVANPS